MTELDYLDRQQARALARIRGALLKDGDLDSTLDAVGDAAASRPWTAIGVGLAVGVAAGAVSGRLPLRLWGRALRLARMPLLGLLRRR